MSVLPYLIIVVLLGLAVGVLASRLLDAPGHVAVDRTILVGVCAAFVAGLFSWYVLNRHGWGMIISVLLSMLAVWLYRRPRTAASHRPRSAGNRGAPAAGNRGAPAARNRGASAAGNRGSRAVDHGRRTPGVRRPPY